MTPKSSGAAIVLSFLWTGLGQLYAGRIARGLLMMAATPVVWIAAWFGGLAGLIGAANVAIGAPGGGGVTVGGFAMALFPFAFWIWGMIDAKKLCERHNAALEARRAA